jgi:hypothetical protein
MMRVKNRSRVRHAPALAATTMLLVAFSWLGCASSVLLAPEYSRDRPWAELSPDSEERLETIQLKNDSGREITALIYERDGDRGSVMVSGGKSMGRKTT